MTLLHRFASVLRWLVHRNRAEQDLHDELQAFVEMAAADKRRDGAAPAEARRLAVLQLGGVEQVKERVRTARHGGWLDEVGRDVRYAARTAARNRGFTIVVVLTLALGIGANTAIFSLADAVLLRALPVSNPRELVVLRQIGPSGDIFPFTSAAAANLAVSRDVLAGLAAFRPVLNTHVSVNGETELAHMQLVSGSMSMDTPPLGELSMAAGITVPGRPADPEDAPQVYHNFVGPRFFETLGIPVLGGRDFELGDDERAPKCVVISESVARRYFPDEDPLGRQILVRGVAASIVGVVKDVRYTSLRADAPLMIYRPYRQESSAPAQTFLIRTASATAEGLTPFLRAEVRALAPALPPPSVVSLEDQVSADRQRTQRVWCGNAWRNHSVPFDRA